MLIGSDAVGENPLSHGASFKPFPGDLVGGLPDSLSAHQAMDLLSSHGPTMAYDANTIANRRTRGAWVEDLGKVRIDTEDHTIDFCYEPSSAQVICIRMYDPVAPMRRVNGTRQDSVIRAELDKLIDQPIVYSSVSDSRKKTIHRTLALSLEGLYPEFADRVDAMTEFERRDVYDSLRTEYENRRDTSLEEIRTQVYSQVIPFEGISEYDFDNSRYRLELFDTYHDSRMGSVLATEVTFCQWVAELIDAYQYAGGVAFGRGSWLTFTNWIGHYDEAASGEAIYLYGMDEGTARRADLHRSLDQFELGLQLFYIVHEARDSHATEVLSTGDPELWRIGPSPRVEAEIIAYRLVRGVGKPSFRSEKWGWVRTLTVPTFVSYEPVTDVHYTK